MSWVQPSPFFCPTSILLQHTSKCCRWESGLTVFLSIHGASAASLERQANVPGSILQTGKQTLEYFYPTFKYSLNFKYKVELTKLQLILLLINALFVRYKCPMDPTECIPIFIDALCTSMFAGSPANQRETSSRFSLWQIQVISTNALLVAYWLQHFQCNVQLKSTRTFSFNVCII